MNGNFLLVCLLVVFSFVRSFFSRFSPLATFDLLRIDLARPLINVDGGLARKGEETERCVRREFDLFRSVICFAFELGGTSYFLPSSSSFLGLSFTMLSYISSRLCWAVLVPRSEEFCSCVCSYLVSFDCVRKVYKMYVVCWLAVRDLN